MAYVAPAGSLELAIDKLVELEEVVRGLCEERDLAQLRVYRWRPLGNVELPAIYNWMEVSPAEWKDASGHRRRDTIIITTRVAVRRGDSDEMTARLERYADLVRDVFDPAFRHGQPLDGAVKWADRPAMQLSGDSFGEVEALAVSFQVQLQVDRFLTPNPIP